MEARGLRVAAIGDVHGCVDELIELYKRLEWLSLDSIWGLGDLVDRGPDSGAVVQFFREKGIPSVLGNHEESILKLWGSKSHKEGTIRNTDKAKTCSQLTEKDIEYIKTFPQLHVFDNIGLVLVHGGLWNRIPLYKQPRNVIRAQMINSKYPGQVRWFGKDADMQASVGASEEEHAKNGWQRWYQVYDHAYDCVFGHSVFNQPLIHQNPGFGKCIGVDTGSCFGGSVTAGIFDGGEPFFVSVRAKKIYFPIEKRRIVELEPT